MTSIERVVIGPKERETLLNLREDHFSDLKAIEIKPAKLSQSIAAFANASGGDLYIGVDEISKNGEKIRQWRGFADEEAANGHIQRFEELFPLGQHFQYDFFESKSDPGLVLHVQVQKTPAIIKASDGKVYVRRGAQKLPLVDEERLRRLRLDKGIESFEVETLDVPTELVSNSIKIIEFLLEVIPIAEPEPWLRKQLLLHGNLPTVAAILLYAEEPQALLPKRCGIKIFRYETEDEATRETLSFNPISVEGCLYDLIYSAVAKTTELIEGIQVLGPKGLVPIRYPKETLHEIITNAVLHRDYSIVTDVQIRIFDNRIEIESPGQLPGHVTTTNILNEQFARNPYIVRLINKFINPPNMDVGEGLNTAFEAMRRLRLKEPIISESENSVTINIRHDRLASPEEAVLDYLKTHNEITNRVTRQLTGINSENKVKDVFYRLRDREILERVPGKKGSASAWRLREDEE